MEEEINYQAIAERLQRELEEARIALLDLRRTRGMLGGVSGDSIRSWVNRNYVVIVVGVMLGTFIVSSLKTILGLFDAKEGE